MTSITVQVVDEVTDSCNDIGAGERGRGGLFWVRHLLQRQSNVLLGFDYIEPNICLSKELLHWLNSVHAQFCLYSVTAACGNPHPDSRQAISKTCLSLAHLPETLGRGDLGKE